MVKRILTAAVVLLAGAAYAQPTPTRHPPKYTVATAPACTDGEPKLFAVTDGSSSTDCAVGGGSTDVICKCIDGTASAVGSGGGGSSSSFETINAPAGTDPVADSATDTLNITCAGGLTCTGTAATDTLDITMGTAATATALAADPSDCAANQFANAIAASGNLTCSALADADIPDTITASGYVPITLAGQQSITATGAGNDITLTTSASGDDLIFAAGDAFTATSGGAMSFTTTAGAVTITAGGATNDITLSTLASGDDIIVQAGGDISIDAAGGIAYITSQGNSGGLGVEEDFTAVVSPDGDTSVYVRDTGITANGAFRLAPSATPPVACAGGTAGGLYIDSNDGLLYYCNGSAWGTVDTDTLPGNDEVTEAMLKAVDTASDEECLTYETTTGDFEWQTCGSAGLGGTTGSTDDAILIADGTGGSTVAASAATLTAAGSLAIPSAETIEFSTDTGLARSAAGVVKVTDGSTGYGGVIVKDGTKTAAALSFATGGVDTGLYQRADNYVMVAAAGKEIAYFNNGSGALTASLSLSSGISFHGGELDAVGATSGIGRYADNIAIITNGGQFNNSIGALHSKVDVEANTAGSGSPNILFNVESGMVLTNEGTTAKNYHTLPSAVAGYKFTFIVQDTDGLRIVANTGDDIHIGATVSTTAGYCESTTVGDSVTLVAINATSFYAVAMMGSGWTCAILFPAFGVRRRLRDLIAANDNL